MRPLAIIFVMIITNSAYANNAWIVTESGITKERPSPPKNIMVFKSPPTTTSPKAYGHTIEQAARANNLEPALIHAVIQTESNYDKDAVSPKGAKGLMQLMDATAKNYKVSDSFDPRQNTRAGAAHLRDLFVRYGNIQHALAAYNAGTKAVDKYKGIPPYPETRQYVEKVLNAYRKISGGSIISDRRQAPMMVPVN